MANYKHIVFEGQTVPTVVLELMDRMRPYIDQYGTDHDFENLIIAFQTTLVCHGLRVTEGAPVWSPGPDRGAPDSPQPGSSTQVLSSSKRVAETSHGTPPAAKRSRREGTATLGPLYYTPRPGPSLPFASTPATPDFSNLKHTSVPRLSPIPQESTLSMHTVEPSSDDDAMMAPVVNRHRHRSAHRRFSRVL